MSLLFLLGCLGTNQKGQAPSEAPILISVAIVLSMAATFIAVLVKQLTDDGKRLASV